MPAEPETLTKVRLDVWLDVACLFATRSEAQRACKGGKIDVNGERAKPHRDVQVGDEVVISRSHSRRQRVVVHALTDRHLKKADARQLYQDVTPPPTPEELEWRRLARAWPPSGGGVPERRERRLLRKLKGRD